MATKVHKREDHAGDRVNISKASSVHAAPHGRVTDDAGKTTHFIVPAAEYAAMISHRDGPSRSAVERAAAMLQDSTTTWHSAEDVMRGIVADGLSRIREKSGLTQTELGKAAKMPQSQVSRLEKSIDGATVRVLRRIAEALARGNGSAKAH